MTTASEQWKAARERAKSPASGNAYERAVSSALDRSPRRVEVVKPKKKSATRKDLTPLEHYSQARVATFLDWTGLLWCHVGNERVKKSEAGKLASQGIKKGVPDVLIFTPPPGGRLSGMAIELKRISRKAKSNPVEGASLEQLQWGDDLQGAGWRWRICYGHVEAIIEICEAYQIKLTKHERAIYLEEF